MKDYGIKTQKRICPICGTEFIPRSHNNKYCSKECSKVARVEHTKQWRKDNRERYLKSSREYNKQHLKERREYARRYYQNHREERIAYSKKYYQKYRTEIMEYKRICRCSLKHNNCFSCPTLDGECLFD